MIVDDSLSVRPTQSVSTSGLDLATISAGREIEGRVMSLTGAQALLAGRFGTLQVDLGTMNAAVGDVLRFEVQSVAGGDGTAQLTLTLVDKTTATAATAAVAVDTPARALADAVGRAVARQTGLAPLFASLAGLASAPQGSVPEPVRTLATQLMNARLGADGTANAAAVARGFQGSGLFLESRLAAAAEVAPSSDLKAGLMALGDALNRWVGAGGASGTGTTAANGAGAAVGASTTEQSAVPATGGTTTPSARADLSGTGDPSSRLATTAYGTPRPVQTASGAGPTVSDGTAANPAVGAASLAAAMVEAATETGLPGRVAAPSLGAGGASGAAAGPTGSSAATTAAAGEAVAAATVAPGATAGQVAVPNGVVSAAVAAPSSVALDAAAMAIARVVMDAVEGAVPPGVTASVAQTEEQRARVDRAARPPPPRRGASPRGQAALPSETATAGDGVEGLGRRTLERVDGALQRILLEQYAVLDRHDDGGVAAAGARAQRHEWTADIPIATRDGTAVMQMTVERDGTRRGSSAVAEAQSDWRVRFALDVEPVGPVTAQIGLVGEHLSIGLWIERPEVAVMLGDEVGQLRGALEAASIPVEAIHVVTGRPPESTRAPASGRFVDLSL